MNMVIMKFRSVLYASVCSVMLAASAAAPAMAGASETEANPNALAVKAMDTLSRGDAQGAVLLFDRAINSRRLDPETLASALVNRALARQKLGRHDKAISDYDAALRIDALSARQRAIALYNRGISWRALGKSAQAIEDFTSALFYDPYFAQAYYSRANVLHRSGQYLFALADYDKALKYGYPKPHRAHYAKALIYRLLERRNDARDELYAALKARPDYKPARRQLAELLNGNGDADLNIRKKPVASPVAPPKGLAEKARAPRLDTGRGTVAPSADGAKPSTRAVRLVVAAGDEARGRGTASVTPAKPAGKGVTVVPARAPAPEKVIHSGLEKEAGAVAQGAAEKPATVAGETPKMKWSGWAIQISSQRSEYYRLRLVGFGEDRRMAKRLCARLKRRGTSCLVTRAGS